MIIGFAGMSHLGLNSCVAAAEKGFNKYVKVSKILDICGNKLNKSSKRETARKIIIIDSGKIRIQALGLKIKAPKPSIDALACEKNNNIIKKTFLWFPGKKIFKLF